MTLIASSASCRAASGVLYPWADMPILQRRTNANIAGVALNEGTSTAIGSMNRVLGLFCSSGSGIGNGIVASAKSNAQEALVNIKQRSGLTWGQIARVFDVSPRSIHLWLNGEALAAKNEERLFRLLRIMRSLPYHTSFQNRQFLLAPQDDGTILFEALCSGDDESIGKYKATQSIIERRSGSMLSPEEQQMRKPLPPYILMNALQDTVHEERGTGRAIKVSKRRK